MNENWIIIIIIIVVIFVSENKQKSKIACFYSAIKYL